MNFNKFVILTVIFLLLGAYVYLFEIGSSKDEEVIADKVEKALDFNAEDVVGVSLKGNGRAILLKKVKGQWKIERPGEPDADNEKVFDLLSFFDYGIVRVIEMNPPDIKEYGLDRPSYEFGVKIAGGESFQTLIIGDDAPGNLSCYAKVKGRTKVVLLGLRYRQEFERALKEFSQALRDAETNNHPN